MDGDVIEESSERLLGNSGSSDSEWVDGSEVDWETTPWTVRSENENREETGTIRKRLVKKSKRVDSFDIEAMEIAGNHGYRIKGLSTIQQTLTPEAASVLNHSIAEAGRRNHGQTTPLHVATTLLGSPSGFLRQACIKSHPNSSHPLQCRALELCFSVALERLPTAQNMSPGMEPPISNALMAALKRAQAHQRRGSPEQQQQPLLAVKVELEQLIISILDDPSVSRVMREASFSSPAVKATIEQSLNSLSSTVNSNSIGLGFRPTAVPPTAPASRNFYLNPRLQQGSATQLGQQRGEEVKRVVDILLRTQKRNPVLVGESEPEAVIRELLKRIENKELREGPFNNAHVVYLEKEIPPDRAQIPAKLKELGDLIETRIGNSGSGGVFVYLGDLKWLVEQPVGFGVTGLGNNMQQQALTEVGRSAVAEMGRLVAMFGEAGAGRLWLLGTATCETYLRCQVYHPSMENDWDLQVVPITNRAPLPGMFPRLGTNGILGSSLEPLSPLKGFRTAAIAPPRPRAPENLDPAGRTTCCPQCLQNYEQELADVLKEIEKSDCEVKPEAGCPSLPQWLQIAKSNSDSAKVKEQKSNSQEVVKRTRELEKKWHDSCLHLHPKFHQQSLGTESISPTPFSMMGMCNLNFLGRQLQPKLQLNKNLGSTQQLSSNPMLPSQPSEQVVSPPGSAVRTELALGQTKAADSTPDQTHKERVKDFLGALTSESQDKFNELQSSKLLDADSYKKLLKGLAEKVWWQQDAASAVATAVTRCKLGNGKTRRGDTKGDMWLLFVGPDRVGKQKMAVALSELVSRSNPVIISVGPRRGDGESNGHVRGKTALDRIAEAVRRNPFSVIMLEDIDEADLLIRGSIKRAMERGRFTDSHGREISLGNVMFILTASWYLSNGTTLDEDKLANLAKGSWQLRLSLSKKTIKRRPSWLSEEDRSTKPRKETNSGLAFDLNEAADAEDDRADGSLNSSDLTVDHEDNQVLNNGRSLTSLVPRELLDAADDAIVFKPVEFSPIGRNFWASISKRFSSIIGNGFSIEVQEEALAKITSGVWLSQTSIDEWIEKVMVPSFHQLKTRFNPSSNSDESFVVKLEEDDGDSDSRRYSEWLPDSVRVVVKGC